MASTYSTSLKLELIGNGDQSGTWGTTTNNNLGTLLEQAITGVQSIVMSNANYVLTDYNGVSDEARNAVLVVTGTNSAVRQIICPLVNKLYVIYNNTSGGYAITIGGSTGSVVTIPNGITAQVYCNGTNFYSSQTGSAGDFTVNGSFYATGNESVTGNMLVGGTLGVTGATTFTGIPSGPTASSGTNTTQLATTAFVTTAINAIVTVPTGTINMWPTGTAPSGYLLCDGTAVSRTTYASLFAVVNTTFGVGDGTTTFNLPNYTSRFPYGASIGTTGGSADAVVVSHTHTITDPGHLHTYDPRGNIGVGGGSYAPVAYGTSTANTSTSTTGITINTAGVSGTNANLPPYLGINFIIKT